MHSSHVLRGHTTKTTERCAKIDNEYGCNRQRESTSTSKHEDNISKGTHDEDRRSTRELGGKAWRGTSDRSGDDYQQGIGT